MSSGRRYEPYKMVAFKELMGFFYGLGWYFRTHDLITIQMQGGFEAFSGQASETWEHQWIVKTADLPDIGVPAVEARGDTLEIACSRALAYLREKGAYHDPDAG